jgi:hypothetical protein
MEVMLDVVVAWGHEGGLVGRGRELADAGADEAVGWPFPAGNERAAPLAATAGAMRELTPR